MKNDQDVQKRLLDLYVATLREMDGEERAELLDDLQYRRGVMVELMVGIMARIRDPNHEPHEHRPEDLALLEREANDIIDHILKTFRIS